MNDGLILEDVGREHINELIKEADQERLAREAAKQQTKKPLLNELRDILLKAVR